MASERSKRRDFLSLSFIAKYKNSDGEKQHVEKQLKISNRKIVHFQFVLMSLKMY